MPRKSTTAKTAATEKKPKTTASKAKSAAKTTQTESSKIKSPEEIQRLKYEIWNDISPTGATALESLSVAAAANVIVAEGDSWFDYPPGLDILDNLKRNHGYKIHKVAQAGDSLENMSYGTDIRRNFSRRIPPIYETLEAVSRYRPKVFLLSAGGNDIAGAELESYLNHSDSGMTPIREDYAKYIFSEVARTAYENILRQVWTIDPAIHIISHGYGYAIPDGRGIYNVFGWFTFIGPWLRPAFAKKNITNTTTAESIIKQLVDKFNDMLAGLDQKYANFHYLDLRNEIKRNGWANELHLYDEGYQRVAEIFHQEIKKYQ